MMLQRMGVRSRFLRVLGQTASAVAGAVLAIGCGIAPESSESARPIREDARQADEGFSVPQSRAGHDRVGLPAPELTVAGWIGSEPLAMRDLLGKVVLIRFFTDGCPYCRATAPALKQLDAEFPELVVIGLHHPKPRGAPPDVAKIEQLVMAWGWTFPVGLDADWTTIDAYWLASGDRAATSASFLIDRGGRIRWVHGGPEYHPGGPADHDDCRRDYAELRVAIAALLAE
jgi:thiol-disulfide isomerase/thioredoxin